MSMKRSSIIASLLFLMLGIIGALRHEIWRDEAQAWMIARASQSLGELWLNLSQEGHPPLWHLFLWLMQSAHLPILSMQIFQVLVGTIGVVILFEKSPFGLLEKVLICFGYFYFYEWSLLSRNYLAANVLLIFAFSHRESWKNDSENAAMFYVPLAVSSLFNVFNLMLAFACGVIVLGRTLREKQKPWLFGTGLLIFCGAFSAYSIARGNFGPNPTSPISLNFFSLETVAKLKDMIINVFAIPEAGWWGVYSLSSEIRLIGPFITGALILSLFVLFVRYKRAGLFLLVSWLTVSWILVGVRSGGYRHSAYLWFSIILALWMVLDEARIQKVHTKNWIFLIPRILCGCCLFLQFLAGGSAYSRDFRREFSSAKRAAQVIEIHASQLGLRTFKLASYPDWTGTPVAAYLDMQIFNPFNKKEVFFVEWGNRKEESDSKSMQNIETFRLEQKLPLYFVTIHHFQPPSHYIKIGDAQEGIIGDERYFIYFTP